MNISKRTRPILISFALLFGVVQFIVLYYSRQWLGIWRNQFPQSSFFALVAFVFVALEIALSISDTKKFIKLPLIAIFGAFVSLLAAITTYTYQDERLFNQNLTRMYLSLDYDAAKFDPERVVAKNMPQAISANPDKIPVPNLLISETQNIHDDLQPLLEIRIGGFWYSALEGFYAAIDDYNLIAESVRRDNFFISSNGISPDKGNVKMLDSFVRQIDNEGFWRAGGESYNFDEMAWCLKLVLADKFRFLAQIDTPFLAQMNIPSGKCDVEHLRESSL